jgi:hypothetical protein
MMAPARRFVAFTGCTILLAATGCFSGTGALRLDRYEGVPGMEQVALLRVEDERGVAADFLGRNLIGYVFIPVMAQTYRSERPVAEGVAQTFIKALESRNIRARYRSELQQPPETSESGTRVYVSLIVKQLEVKSTLLHLVLAFGPSGTKWKSHVEFEISATQPGQAAPFWSGTVSGQGHSVYDVERAMREYEAGVSYPEISANVQRAALDAAMAEAFDAFFQEVDLTDLPVPGPTPPAQTDDFSPMP